MGVGVAFPRSQFTLANSDIVCVPDSKVGGWGENGKPWKDRQPATPVVEESQNAIVARKTLQSVSLPFKMVWRGFGAFFTAFRAIWIPPPVFKKVDSPWDLAKNRVNSIICLRLRPKAATEDDALDFLVATYHMPCQFWEPATMSIHTLICLQLLQQFSEGKYPSILAGDFNFKPNSPQYALTTTGTLPPTVVDPNDPEVNGKASLPAEPLYPNDPFAFQLPRGPMKSAYAVVQGREPPFTNHAMAANQTKVFSETLDYIFFKDGEKFKGKKTTLTPVNVLDLSSTCGTIRDKNVKSLPNETESSDHLLIAADFVVEAT